MPALNVIYVHENLIWVEYGNLILDELATAQETHNRHSAL